MSVRVSVGEWKESSSRIFFSMITILQVVIRRVRWSFLSDFGSHVQAHTYGSTTVRIQVWRFPCNKRWSRRIFAAIRLVSGSVCWGRIQNRSSILVINTINLNHQSRPPISRRPYWGSIMGTEEEQFQDSKHPTLACAGLFPCHCLSDVARCGLKVLIPTCAGSVLCH